MQKWYSTLFQLSPPSRRKFLFIERSLEFQKSQIGPHLHLSLSPGALFSRRPPYAAGGLRPPRARGQMDPGKPLSATWPPLGTSSRAHASQTPPRAATTPRPAQRRCLLRPLAVEPSRTNSTAPSHSIPHTGALWPIKTPRTPQSRPFSSFFFLPPLRHGRRDPALADRLAQPHIAPSDHRNSFATS